MVRFCNDLRNLKRVKYWTIKSLRPNPLSVEARLPDVYKNYQEQLKKDPSPVHYAPEQGKWKKDPETGEKQRIENVPLPILYPKEADEGLWGGEGVVKGFYERKAKSKLNFTKRYSSFTLYKFVPNYWVPTLKKSIVYSEILNKYMIVTVTERTLRLIDKHFGFDNYILETPAQDLKSQLGLSLRHKMLMALATRERLHDDEKQQEKIWNKYKRFELPLEETEWIGLTKREAVKKQRILEEKEKKPVPLKYEFRKLYLQELMEGKQEQEQEEQKSPLSSLISKVPFIGKKD